MQGNSSKQGPQHGNGRELESWRWPSGHGHLGPRYCGLGLCSSIRSTRLCPESWGGLGLRCGEVCRAKLEPCISPELQRCGSFFVSHGNPSPATPQGSARAESDRGSTEYVVDSLMGSMAQLNESHSSAPACTDSLCPLSLPFKKMTNRYYQARKTREDLPLT
jgi:hypothetical protein